MNSDRSVVQDRSRLQDSPLFRLADRWRQAAWAIEASRISFARIEDDYLADRDNANREAAYHQAARHQEELFDRLSAVRTELYSSEPGTSGEAVALLEIVRLSEEDVFEDPELATAIDHVIAALSRGQPSVS